MQGSIDRLAANIEVLSRNIGQPDSSSQQQRKAAAQPTAPKKGVLDTLHSAADLGKKVTDIASTVDAMRKDNQRAAEQQRVENVVAEREATSERQRVDLQRQAKEVKQDKRDAKHQKDSLRNYIESNKVLSKINTGIGTLGKNFEFTGLRELGGWIKENAKQVGAAMSVAYSLGQAYQSTMELAYSRMNYGTNTKEANRTFLGRQWENFNLNYTKRNEEGELENKPLTAWDRFSGQTHRGAMAKSGLAYGYSTREMEETSYRLNEMFGDLGKDVKQTTDDVAMFSRVFKISLDESMGLYDNFYKKYGMRNKEIFNTLSEMSTFYQKYITAPQYRMTQKEYMAGVEEVYEMAMANDRSLSQLTGTYTHLAASFAKMGFHGEKAARAAAKMTNALEDTSQYGENFKAIIADTTWKESGIREQVKGKSRDELIAQFTANAMKDEKNVGTDGKLTSEAAALVKTMANQLSLASKNDSAVLIPELMAKIAQDDKYQQIAGIEQFEGRGRVLDKMLGDALQNGGAEMIKVIRENYLQGMSEDEVAMLVADAQARGLTMEQMLKEMRNNTKVSHADVQAQIAANEKGAEGVGFALAPLEQMASNIKDIVASYPMILASLAIIIALMKAGAIRAALTKLRGGDLKGALSAFLGLKSKAAAVSVANASRTAQAAAGGSRVAGGLAGARQAFNSPVVGAGAGMKLAGGAAAVVAGGVAGYSKYHESKAANESDAKAISRGVGTGVGTAAGGVAGAAIGAKAGAATGAMIGAFGGPIGVAAGAIIGGALGALAGGFGGAELGAMAGDAVGAAVGDVIDKPKEPKAGGTEPVNPMMAGRFGGTFNQGRPTATPVAPVPTPIAAAPAVVGEGGGIGNTVYDAQMRSNGDMLLIRNMGKNLTQWQDTQKSMNTKPIVGNGASQG